MRVEGIRIKQDLNKIIPYLKELMNNHKAIKNGSNEWKTQLIGHISFVSLERGLLLIFMFGLKMRKLDKVMKQMILLKVLLILIYQKEQQVSREKSNLVFECVDLMSY